MIRFKGEKLSHQTEPVPHRRPDPVRRALQALDRLVVADLTGFELTQHGVQLIEL